MDTNTNTNFTDFQTGKFKYTEFKYAEFNDGVHFFCFPREIPFFCKFGPKNQNYQFELKFGTYTNLNRQIKWWCSLFPFSTKNTFLGRHIWSKKSKLPVWTEIWYLDDDDADFFCFQPKITFLGKFDQQTQNLQFKLKFGI